MLWADLLREVIAWITQRLAALGLVDVVTLATLVVTATKVALGRPGPMLRRGRHAALRGLGVPREATRERVRGLLAGHVSAPAQELSWLAGALGRPVDEALTFGDPQRVREVAAAYRAYAARLDAGRLLGANHAPVVRADAELARAVAALVEQYLGLVVVSTTTAALTVPHRAVELEFLGCSNDGIGPALQAQDLAISYRASRLGVRPRDEEPSAPGSRQDATRDDRPYRTLDMSEEERQRIGAFFASGRVFDGALPRLVDWAAVRDESSGHQTIHLSLAETTYGCVVVDHYPRALLGSGDAEKTPRPVIGSRVRLLTLTLVVVCAGEHLVFSRRSRRAGSHRGRLGGTVNGNLEFDPRRGLTPDLDANGLPDPRLALAREAQEELGFSVPHEDIFVTGLGRFDNPDEKGTHVLLTCATTPLTRDEVLAHLPLADPVEGSWELDTTIVSLRVPRNERDLQRAVDWLVGSSEFSPHGTMAGLGALAVACRDDDILTRVQASSGLRGEVPRPAGLVEESSMRGWRRS